MHSSQVEVVRAERTEGVVGGIRTAMPVAVLPRVARRLAEVKLAETAVLLAAQQRGRQRVVACMADESVQLAEFEQRLVVEPLGAGPLLAAPVVRVRALAPLVPVIQVRHPVPRRPPRLES